ncbi:A24 family peptidase [Nocardioides sp. P86]|uniref:prepilin peptidase n=1 Tax=Nocardioides sp. P86 TaxID=2939569 RepID=UPI0020411810|nr:A24 family peptidase [Nocardioides sp. P86]MCM3513694.1 A24 family peptidase [Nocardioides sp. P86]
MSDAAAELLVVALAVLGCGLAGLGVPALIRALPEPPAPASAADTPADPPADPAAGAATGTLAGAEAPHGPTTGSGPASAARPAEPPKPLYVDLAARPHLGPWVALVSAMAGGLVARAALGDGLTEETAWALAYALPVVPLCVALAYVDGHTRLLPSRLVLPATGALVLLALGEWVVTGEHDAVLRAGVGLLVARSLYWLLWAVHSAGMGFGDVRLAALLGLVLGRLGVAELVVGVYAGFLVFGLPGLLLALVRRDRALLRAAYPFGPFMVVGALIGVLTGPAVIDSLLR